MFSGKTKRGVEVRSTRGMKSPSSGPTWMIVADRSRVRVFEAARRSMRAVDELAFPEGRMKASELVSDRPGRSFDSQDSTRHGQTGGARHAYSQQRSLKDQVVQRMASKTAARLKRGKKRIDRVILIAEPKLAGMLKPTLRSAVPSVPFATRESDFSWIEGKELESRLLAILKEPR